MSQPYPDHPQLRGNFAPLRMECDLDDVIISGEMPRDLDVTYYRNGPDPQFPPRGHHHWFGGCLLYTSPSPRDQRGSRMPSSA